MTRLLFGILIAGVLGAFSAAVLVARIDSGTYDTRVEAAVSLVGQGPLLRPQERARGASGYGRTAVLVEARTATQIRAIALELRARGVGALVAVSASDVVADRALAREVVGLGHEVAYAGLTPRGDATLAEGLWRVGETLGLRAVENAAGTRVRFFAAPRLAVDAPDQPALELARRALLIDLIPLITSPAASSPTDLDGLVVVTTPAEAKAVAIVRNVEGRALAGLAPTTPPSSLATFVGGAVLSAADGARAVAGLLDILALLATGLYLLRLVIVALVAVAHSRRGSARRLAGASVAVLVPAYREALVIGACVRSLRQSDHRDLEIVVIDDGSDDDTAQLARAAAADDPRVRVVQKPNGGKASALNAGLAATRSSLIVVVDADSIVEPSAIGALIAPLADPSVGAAAGNVKVGNRRSVLGALQHLEYVMGINLDRRFFDIVKAVSVVPGALGAFRREAILAAGGFPTDTLAEDADLTVAIGAQGLLARHVAAARAWTEVPENIGALRRQRFRWAYGTLQVLWKHRGVPTRRGSTNVGRLGLPYLLIFGYVLPLTSVAFDAQILFRLAVGVVTPEVLVMVGLFTAAQLAAAALALWLDRESLAWTPLLLAQQLGYRQFLAFVAVSSLWAAVAGMQVGWGNLKRRGLARFAQP